MGRTRNKVQKPSFWETPNPNARQFGRLYPDLDKHPSFTALNFSARCLYLSMIQASAGKREFHFTVSEYKSRGWNATTFTRARDELVAAGFIEFARRGKTTRQPNIYRFSAKWLGKDY